MPYSDTVMFAIQGGLRLYGASRKAYADSVRGAALTLPLPRAPGVEVDSAENWFLTSEPGTAILAATPRIKALMEMPMSERSAAQKAELVDLYKFYWSQANPQDKDADDVRGGPSGDEMLALLEVRQWSDTELGQMASPLQTITGTLVNVAIDYFVETPGAVSTNRPHGRALKALLDGLDQTDFAAVPPRELATGLTVALLDAVSANPDVLGGGDNEQTLITNVTRSLAESATAFLEESTSTERRDAGVWLELMAFALFDGAATTVLAEPGRYLRVNPGTESDVIIEVGNTLASLLLGERRLTFRRLLSAEGINKITKSALAAVAKNPGLLKVSNKGLENVIVALAENLSGMEARLSPDIFPEVVRLVMDKSADNLELIWRPSLSDPRRHLLVSAITSMLKSISKAPPANTKWKPQLTPDQLLGVAETVLDEVVDNPAWLIDEAGQSSGHLQAAIEAILASLRQVPGDRLSAETGIAVLRAGIGAIALRISLLEPLSGPAGEPAQAAITHALDAVFGEIFAEGVTADASWNLARNSVLQSVCEIALATLARHGVGQQQITVLRDLIREQMSEQLAFDPDDFAAILNQRLLAA